MMVQINACFDSGNIEVINSQSPDNIELSIRQDTQAEFRQWFFFRVSGAQTTPLTMSITNAGQCSYPEGWEGYQACASYDREYWFRVPTEYQNGQLVIKHTPDSNQIYYAYFAPYSWDRHCNLIAALQQEAKLEVQQIGVSVEGRPLDLVVAGNTEAPEKTLWLIARQHPGESMAEWFMEGLLNRLMDYSDPVSNQLLERCAIYIVPNMNPDGTFQGNLRANAAGRNLNREWSEPCPEASPEVFHVLNKMKETGVDLFLDIHGDEGLPYIFLAGCEGNPGFSSRIDTLQNEFTNTLIALSPDLQNKYGYDKDKPGEANLTIASNAVGQRFDCLSYTLEMPFKDNNLLPDLEQGWSAERSETLGTTVLTAVYQMLEKLR